MMAQTFEDWCESLWDALYAEYMETGAYYDQDLEAWLERRFEALISTE